MRTTDALNRLCKWRSILAGWHLGTQAANAPGVQAMRDLQDFRLCIRAETNAITQLLIDKAVFTADEFRARLEIEAVLLERQLQEKFPGYRASDEGMVVTPTVAEKTNRAMGFPP